ncbi:ArsR/SmtB family transcription factor [Miltoncostaea marina]|uniref:ArsR/SmtB family transcription factor n=1 Tax=Miltoncostaea marina TaxID=2843215 RepID=UPI001C3D2640|nr:metalloregulator ArsR/SmtB family transcription factor [Miltoncostaea marina]
MSHRADEPAAAPAIDAAVAGEVADALRALASPSRLLLLSRLRQGPCPVGELARAAALSPSAASHQLAQLRHMGWVARARDGRHIVYRLHDPHVGDLIDQAVLHLEHVRLGRGAASSEVRA